MIFLTVASLILSHMAIFVVVKKKVETVAGPASTTIGINSWRAVAWCCLPAELREAAAGTETYTTAGNMQTPFSGAPTRARGVRASFGQWLGGRCPQDAQHSRLAALTQERRCRPDYLPDSFEGGAATVETDTEATSYCSEKLVNEECPIVVKAWNLKGIKARFLKRTYVKSRRPVMKKVKTWLSAEYHWLGHDITLWLLDRPDLQPFYVIIEIISEQTHRTHQSFLSWLSTHDWLVTRCWRKGNWTLTHIWQPYAARSWPWLCAHCISYVYPRSGLGSSEGCLLLA